MMRSTAQEAFIRGCVRLNQLRNPEKFANWLKQITVSLCMDRLRGMRLESQLSIPLNETNEKELPYKSRYAIRCSEKHVLVYFIVE